MVLLLLTSCNVEPAADPPDDTTQTDTSAPRDTAVVGTSSVGAGCTTDTDDGDPYNNQPAWSTCDTDEVCVLAESTDLDDDGGPLFTCVLPEPATPLDWGVELERGWAPYEVASARCNSGDLARFYFRPAHDELGTPIASDDWLVFLKGGDGCAGAPSCAARWTTHPFYVAAPRATWAPSEEGIFRTTDNAFSAMNQVYVHYCSSDSFRGMGPRSPNTGLHHDGHQTVDEVFDALEAGLLFRPTASDPATTYALAPTSRVLFSGGSAGSDGAAHHLDHIAARAGDAQVVGLLDSRWIAPVLPGDRVAKPTDFDRWTHPGCAAAHPTELWRCDDLFHLGTGDAGVDAGHIETSFLAYQAVLDGRAYPYSGVCVSAVSTCDAPLLDLGGLCAEPTTTEPVVEGCDHGSDALNEADPLGLACWDDAGAGAGGHVVDEGAVHVNSCTSELTSSGIVDAFDDCAADQTCWAGHCVRTDFRFACESSDDCGLDEDLCMRGVCVHPAVLDADDDFVECLDPRYGYDQDTGQCSLSIGCGDDGDCDAAEVCLGKYEAMAAGELRLGIRQGFASSSLDAYFVTDGRTKHTIINTSDNAFFSVFGDMRPDGAPTTVDRSLHDTLLELLQDGPGPGTRLIQDRQ